MTKIKTKPLATAIGAAVVGTFLIGSGVNAAENPFAMKEIGNGHLQLASNVDGKCGAGKCGASKAAGEANKAEGKCGAGKCGANKAAPAEGKCGAGKCGANKAAPAEGKCGAGKCGASK